MAANGSVARPSSVALVIVLTLAIVGAVSIARQGIIVPPLAPPEPAWASVGHDNAHTGHSRSLPVNGPITLLNRFVFNPGESVAGSPAIDGGGNAYFVRQDRAIHALGKDGDTMWCYALQPITDTTCTGSGSIVPVPLLGTVPSALAAPDREVYVVGPFGQFIRFDPTKAVPSYSISGSLVSSSGLVASKDRVLTDVHGVEPFFLYGVVRQASGRFAVTKLNQDGTRAAGWRDTLIRARQLTAVSVAPDGTPLVVATAPRVGAVATLYALSFGDGRVLWRVDLAPGYPSYASVEGTTSGWVAWVAVNAQQQSSVVVVDNKQRKLWQRTIGHHVVVSNGGLALAHPMWGRPAHNGLAYLSSDAGIYLFDLAHRRMGIFGLDARLSTVGMPGAPVLDEGNNLYVGTSRGHVYAIAPSGRTLWRYDTGRDARFAVEPYPSDSTAVLVVSHDTRLNQDVVEKLGEGPGGLPVATGVAIACAAPDCPTATPTVTPTTVPTETSTPVPPTVTATSAPTAMPTATLPPVTAG